MPSDMPWRCLTETLAARNTFLRSQWNAAHLIRSCAAVRIGHFLTRGTHGRGKFDGTAAIRRIGRTDRDFSLQASVSGSARSVVAGHLQGELTPAEDLLHLKPGQRVSLAGWLIQIRIVSKYVAFAVLLLPRGQGRLQLMVRRNDDGDEQSTSDVTEAWQRAGVHGVVQVHGTFVERPQSAQKEQDVYSRFELQVDACNILNSVLPDAMPFNPTIVGSESREEVRLRNRHLDLRNPDRGENIRLRSRVTWAARSFLHENGFDEIETPILLRSSPEGAREYLVPTRFSSSKPQTSSVNPDERRAQQPHFYALQQSPQQPKQLLVVSGVTDRYFQVARCFRDEDGRKDRQPEFTQIDVEMSFVFDQARQSSDWPLGGEEVRRVTEGMMKAMWRAAGRQKELEVAATPAGFRVMQYDEAMMRYGSDKPDLRYGMELGQLGDTLLRNSHSANEAEEDVKDEAGEVEALCFTVPDSSNISRKDVERLLLQNKTITEDVEVFWGRSDAPNELSKLLLRKSSVIRKFLEANEVETEQVDVEQIRSTLEDLRHKGLPSMAGLGDLDAGERTCTFVASRSKYADGGSTKLGDVRRMLMQELEERNLVSLNALPTSFVWIVEFPLFTRSDKDKSDLSFGRWSSTHHPFTSPKHADAHRVKELLTKRAQDRTSAEDRWLARVKGQHYDIVVNGVEIGGGSVRIHDAHLQALVLRNMLLLSNDELERFDHLLRALQHGAPPHAGIALGLDRLMATLCNASTIRDVIAFPKAHNGRDLLFGSPDVLQQQQLLPIDDDQTNIKRQTDKALHVYGLQSI